jgi:hypothetical protein
MEEYRNAFEWTPQSEAWVEAACWIAEEKRARVRDDPTEEAFARLAFQLCMQHTQETDAHQDRDLLLLKDPDPVGSGLCAIQRSAWKVDSLKLRKIRSRPPFERQAALLSRVAYHVAIHTICER